jgi:hypothetical protein
MADITKLGASNTDVKDLQKQLNLGALSYFPSAVKFAEELIPTTPTISPEEQAFLFFTNMAASASKPGATAIGSAGEAGQQLVQSRIAQRAAEAKRSSDVASVAGSIFSAIKPKVGAPSTKMIGAALDIDGNPKYNDNGKQLFKFQLFDAAGNPQGDPFEATRSDAGTTINMPGEKVYAEGVSTGIIEYYRGTGKGDTYRPGVEGKYWEAQDQIGRLERMEELLADPDFRTGIGQDRINTVKQLLNRVGVADFDQEALAKAESFESISNQITLSLVAQMKGALSDKELDFLRGIAPSLSNTKEGNRLLIMMAKHALQKDLEFPAFFEKYKADNNIDPDADVLLMVPGDLEASQVEASKLRSQYQAFQRRERPSMYEYAKSLADKESRDMQRKGIRPQKIKEYIMDKYLLNLLEEQHNKSFF